MKNKFIGTILILLAFHNLGLTQLHAIDSPVKNFEKLWKVFNNRYANFELKQVDWQEIYEKYRVEVNRETTNIELFKISCAMLQELKDGHVTIEPNFKEDDEIECGPPYEFSLVVAFKTEDEQRKFSAVMDHELMQNGFSKPMKENLTEDTNYQYRSSDSYGYLRLDEMTEKITFGKFKRTVDKSMAAFQSKKGLILDLRFNGGGWDHHAYVLVSRLIPKGETVAHYEHTRIKGENDYTALKRKTVKSAGKNQFTKPIVILTSDFTASATEVFLLLMRELPNVTIIGDDTEGIFSDMYFFKLPNKWKISLSHQQFFSKDMENFEGTGIPPDIRMLNSTMDIETQSDPVIKTAMDYLERETNK